jgi:hypothetical protein
VFDGAVGVMFDGVVGAMFNGVMGVYIHLGVYDSFVGVASRSPSFDIFIKVPYSSFNVYGLLEIKRRWLIMFLVLVLFLWIEGKMWCRLQIMALVDLEM